MVSLNKLFKHFLYLCSLVKDLARFLLKISTF